MKACLVSFVSAYIAITMLKLFQCFLFKCLYLCLYILCFLRKSDKHDTAYIIYPINFIQRKETVQEDSLDRMKLVEEFIPNVKVETVSCSAIIRGDLQEITKGTVVKSRTSKVEYYLNIAKNCSKFVNQRKYSIKPLSEEEASFPIAFSLLVYKNVEQVERLLRAIYRPQNYYCIHVDLKSQDAFKEAMKGIVSCFPNVFLASKMVSITWGKPSVLEPELICMRDLWNYTTWKYVCIFVLCHEFIHVKLPKHQFRLNLHTITQH